MKSRLLLGLRRGVPAASRKFSCTAQAQDKLGLFTAEIPKHLLKDSEGLLERLGELSRKNSKFASRGNGHNAAVVLATPGLTRLIDQSSSSNRLAEYLSSSGYNGDFHLVTAIVDQITSISRPPFADNEGISVLTGPSATILPGLWDSSIERERKSKDDVGALTFDLGDTSTATIPLARTIFQNSKISTLITSRFEVSDGAARLIESREKFDQQINIPLNGLPDASTRKANLWLPLKGLTQPRTVTESFGNILRRLKIDGASAPASIELEASVNEIYKHIQKKLPPGVEVPLMGAWAVVKPEAGQSDQVRNLEIENLEDDSGNESLVRAMANGGRVFKLLSGGGGWGTKAGLLSFDPETSHFAASEEDEFRSLFGNGGQSEFVPVGSEVQFFCSDVWSKEAQLKRNGSDKLHPLAFGVFGDAAKLAPEAEGEGDIVLTPDHFGAVSYSSIYVSEGEASPFKLSVPGSQLSIS